MAVWELFWRESGTLEGKPKGQKDGSHNTTGGPLDLLPYLNPEA